MQQRKQAESGEKWKEACERLSSKALVFVSRPNSTYQPDLGPVRLCKYLGRDRADSAFSKLGQPAKGSAGLCGTAGKEMMDPGLL